LKVENITFFENAIICKSLELEKYYFRLCSYLVQVHKTCLIVRMHLQCSHVGTGSLLRR